MKLVAASNGRKAILVFKHSLIQVRFSARYSVLLPSWLIDFHPLGLMIVFFNRYRFHEHKGGREIFYKAQKAHDQVEDD